MSVADTDLASFQELRPRLHGIARRVLGSAADADDVVQDAWIRWHGADRAGVRDTAAFLATTTTRLAINEIQSAHARRETGMEPRLVDRADTRADPVLDAQRGEAVEHGVRELMEKLSPTERAVFVLREAFDYPYRDISQVLPLSEQNARQLLTRARRRLASEQRRSVDAAERRRLLGAFNAAATNGDLAPLEHLLAAGIAA
jgi:RNA polymerase sigma-70 factor (ECF subfamily)